MSRRLLARLVGPGRVAGPFAAVLVALAFVASSVSAATGWTGPSLVGKADNCYDAAAAIDASGGAHVVAGCGSNVRYSASTASGGWTTTHFARPSGLDELEPKVAVDGSTVYVAFSRNAPASCGFDWQGVFYRTRALPSGSWSAARPLGKFGDHLQSFSVVNGTLYATVDNGAQVLYESQLNGVYHQWILTDAVGRASLAVGSDGRARIVYEAAHSIRYATFTGSGFTKATIPGTTGNDRSPVIALDGGNHAHVVWTHTPQLGCGGGPEPAGVYYATNASGAWTPPAGRRFTSDVGDASLVVEPTTRRVHVLLAGFFGVRYFTEPATGGWTMQQLTTSAASTASLQSDPGSGGLLAVYVRDPGDTTSASIFAFTKN